MDEVHYIQNISALRLYKSRYNQLFHKLHFERQLNIRFIWVFIQIKYKQKNDV